MARRPNKVRHGFTIMEVIVAAFITAIAVTALVGVLGHVSNVQARIFLSERLERAADEKLNELIATGEITSDGEGGFDDEEESDLTWASTYETTGTENLSYARVTVSRGDKSAVAERLIFIPPATQEGGAQTEGQNPGGATP